jgi:hypothetical protein
MATTLALPVVDLGPHLADEPGALAATAVLT